MRYKINYEPLYEDECNDILSYIINDKSIKTDMNEMITNRGSKYKSVITQYFKQSIELEKYIKKHITFSMPGYETTGQQLAEFLFRERDITKYLFAKATFYCNYFANETSADKEIAILATVDGDLILSILEMDTPPPPITYSEFFTLLDKCQTSDENKLDAMRMYHNFDLYLGYYTAITTQVKELILAHRPNIIAEMTPLMDRMNTEAQTIVRDEFNVTLDDKQLYSVYPSIYRVNSASLMTVGYAEKAPFTIGFHMLDLNDLFKDTKTAGEDAEAFLKCISDSTKLSILKLLKDSPMYGSQLAEKLSCTGANISHHASALLSLGLVHYEKENNRIYIHLDKEKIIRHIDDLKELF